MHYAGLPSSPWRQAARKYLPGGAGAIVSLELRGGAEAGRAFVDGTELFSQLANIGDVRSLIVHPASTTHSQLTPEEQAVTGVTPGLVRLSVGLEGVEDLKADLEAGFRAAKAAGGSGCGWTALCRWSAEASCPPSNSPMRPGERWPRTGPTPSLSCTR